MGTHTASTTNVFTREDGSPSTVFFDFDDAGPGFLAYDLRVLAWSHLIRNGLKEPDAVLRERGAHYLRGYRPGGGEVSDADLAALPLFVQLRHLWNMGAAAGRLHHWVSCTVAHEHNCLPPRKLRAGGPHQHQKWTMWVFVH